MCSILGVFDLRPGADLTPLRPLALSLSARQRHRGPDWSGVHVDANALLVHERLAIVDPAGGAQPIHSADGELALAVNGEIYNHRELERRLARPYAFQTGSDCEVINALHRDGEPPATWLGRLNGIFAFAIWDTERRRLFLARDRFGEKPLYYCERNGVFAFASELSALLRHRRIDPEIDLLAAQKYFAHGFIPAPNGFYRGCLKLPGGWRMSYDIRSRSIAASPYWRFRLQPDPTFEKRIEAELAEELRALLFQSVSRRLISDVPLGLFLSGGVDSSTVLAGAAAAMPASAVKTFCIGFEEPSFDESEYARGVAQAFGAVHHERRLGFEEARAAVAPVLSRMDEPLADGSILPTHMLARFTREHVTVALSGDGGDELFAGYDPLAALGPAALYERLVPPALHRAARGLAARLPLSARNMSLDFKLRRALAGLSYPRALWNAVWLGPLEPREIADLFARPADAEELYGEVLALWREGEEAGLSLLDRTLEFYTRFYLQDDVLTKVDRMSMSVSLEARVPLLARRVIEFSFGLREELRFYGGEPKGLLRHAYRGILPDHILDRRKKGFGIPRYYLKDVSGGRFIQEHVLRSLFLGATVEH